MSEAMRRLGQLSREYEARATAYAELATSAANAEASHKHARAIHMLESRAGDPKMAVSWAETLADADPEVAGLLRERLETGAIADAARAKLSQLREAVATGRSVMVGEREQDRLHSAGLGGAA